MRRDLPQGTKDKIEHMKVLGTKIDKRVRRIFFRFTNITSISVCSLAVKMPSARRMFEKQTNSTFVDFKLKDEGEFEGWLKDIYSAISQVYGSGTRRRDGGDAMLTSGICRMK